MSDIVEYSEQTFESIKHINEYGEEYWLARELQAVLEYAQWRRFAEAIERARLACKNSGFNPEEHFADVGKSSPMPHGGFRVLDDVMLSRYACYLIVMNGDPRKEVIAVGQTYFAVKTRQQELIDNYEQLTEDQKRLAIRNEMIAHNKSLAEAAQMAGVIDPRDYAIFQNKGYQGLYGGLGAKEIHERKGLKKSQKILDRGVRSLLQTFSARHKLTRSCEETTFRENKQLMRLITRLAGRFARPSKKLGEQCRRICPHRSKA